MQILFSEKALFSIMYEPELKIPVFLQARPILTSKRHLELHTSPRHCKEHVEIEHGVGVTKWFSESNGFGFLTYLEGPEKGKDVFVHIQAVSALGQDFLTKGTRYEFDVNHRKSDGKKFAINLKRIYD